MLRYIFTLFSLIFFVQAFTTHPASAQSEASILPADEILTALQSHGYEIVENSHTWLGRQRILAEKNGTLREVVFIPTTGEILRDYSVRSLPQDGSKFAEDSDEDDKSSSRASRAANLDGSVADSPSPSASVRDALGVGIAADNPATAP